MRAVISQVREESELVAFRDVISAALEADFVAMPADPIEDFRPALDGPINGQRYEYWMGRRDGTPSAAATIVLPLHDNVQTSLLGIYVSPEFRGQGHGREVADAALDRIRALGRSRVLSEVASRTREVAPSPGDRLCRSLGFRPVLASKRRVLDLSTIDDAHLDRLTAAAAGKSAGYSAVSWCGRAADEYVGGLARLSGLMSTDPPQGDLGMEPESWDDKRYRQSEDDIDARGRRRLTTAVVHDATGEVAGLSEIGIAIGQPEVAFQWNTIVAGEHRGHRLGLLSKVTNLRFFRGEAPWVRYLNTWNADDNVHMVPINISLGFEVAEEWNEWRLDLT